MPELVSYLNEYFAVEVWRATFDLLGNISVSEAVENARNFPLVKDFTDCRFDFASPPTIADAGGNSVSVRLPGAGSHRLSGTLVTASPLPNADVEVDFQVELRADADQPRPQPNLDVHINWGGTAGDIAAVVLGGGIAFILKRLVEAGMQTFVEGKLKDALIKRLSGLQTYRFENNQALRPQDPDHLIVRAFAPGFSGSSKPFDKGYCDILLVADGFGEDNVRKFNDLVDGVRDHFGNKASLEAPFRQFSTDIRLWKMSLIVDEPPNPLKRVLIPVKISDRNTFNFANLARLAEIGLTAREFFNRDPIMVLVSWISQQDKEGSGIPLGFELRENSQGPYVLLAIDSGRGQAATTDAINTLIHELGHTPLGRHLADEYGSGDGKIYHGLEPKPRNVSVNSTLGWSKWQPWSPSIGSLTASAGDREGAYAFDQGIFRFQRDCRMRSAPFGEFCPICREELAFGMLERGHYQSGGRTPGFIDVGVEILRPFALVLREAGNPFHLPGDDDAEELPAFVGSGNDFPTTRARLSVFGSSVPEPWQIKWQVTGPAGSGLFGIYSEPTVVLDVVPQTSLVLTVAHQFDGNPATDIIAPSQAAPTTAIYFRFVLEVRVDAADLLLPDHLEQSVKPPGSALVPIIDEATGHVHLPQPLWLQANPGFVRKDVLGSGARNLALMTSVEFQLDGPGDRQSTYRSIPGNPGTSRRWLFDRMLPPGQYVWSARTLWGGLSSGWIPADRGNAGYCFKIGDLHFPKDRQRPVEPFDLILDETATYPPLPDGLRASSWHPSDLRIKFQFEYQRHDDRHPIAGETDLLERDRGNFDSVAITGHIFFNLLPRPGESGVLYTWRVRAGDERDEWSEWVNGRPFLIYLPDQRPTTIRHLGEILKTVDKRMLDPRGPVEIPRLFLTPEWPQERPETDWSILEKLIKDRSYAL